MNFPIDFVISWVDNSDVKWKNKKNMYLSKVNGIDISDATDERYRDFGFFRYLFRSIEKYTPWVNHIYLVTDKQIPKFLNKNNKKITVVDHTDFIPGQYLPTFNSSVIELYLDQIPDLSEHFVYFNDDMLINRKLEPLDFFDERGFPKDIWISSELQPLYVSYFEVNNMRVINKYFPKNDTIVKNWKKLFNYKYGTKNLFKTALTLPFKNWSAFKNTHLPYSLKKSEYNWLNKYAKEQLKLTSQNKFRSDRDINIWILQNIRYCLGKFSPRSYKDGKYFNFDSKNSLLFALNKEKHKLIVINDDSENKNLSRSKVADEIIRVLDKRFPIKSHFEL